MNGYFDKIIILGSGVSEIQINAPKILSQIVSKDNETVIKTTVKTIRENIMKFFNNIRKKVGHQQCMNCKLMYVSILSLLTRL